MEDQEKSVLNEMILSEKGPYYVTVDGVVQSFMRAHAFEAMEIQLFGPKPVDHPTIDSICQSCTKPFKKGDYTTLVPLGPGLDSEAEEKIKNNRWYNAVALEVHWRCYVGEEPPIPEEK